MPSFFRCLTVGFSALLLSCQGRGRCEDQPFVRVSNIGCEDVPDGVVVEDSDTFLDLCGVEAQDEDFEPIDFDEYVVLGLTADGSGCTVDFEQNTCRNERTETITYEIHVRSRGTCQMAASFTGWVAVERPDPGWSFEFDVREI